MFEVGKVYKVKVEVTPGEVGFGRATVLDRKGNQLTVQIRTSKESNADFPIGTRLWFVSDSTEVFSGLWGSSVTETQQSGERVLMVCSPPKLEPLNQRRRTPRVSVDLPVQMKLGDVAINEVRTKDISRSGIALEAPGLLPDTAEVGDELSMTIQSSVGAIPATACIIRIDNNWLANKTILGLEFTKLPAESIAMLDKLLVLLGGKPRNPEAASEQKREFGLASWISSPVEVKGRFVGTQESQVGSETDSSEGV